MKFVELLREQNIDYRTEGHHHTRPGWIQFDCPFCGTGSKKWHMGYNVSFGYVNCWRCGPHGVLETMTQVLDLDARQASTLLRDVVKETSPRELKPRGKLVPPRGVGVLGSQHRRYLRKRGFDPNTLAQLWGIGGIGPTLGEGMQWRIYIPIYLYGDIVSWTTRSIDDKVASTYKMAQSHQEAIHYHSLIYGEDYVRSTALVFEGPPDVWRVGPGSVCTFGIQWSQEQLLRLTKYQRVVTCFDLEKAAQKRAEQMRHKLILLGVDTQNEIIKRKGRDMDTKQVEKLRETWL